jgi:hypothetical protein
MQEVFSSITWAGSMDRASELNIVGGVGLTCGVNNA